ncbi:phospholipase A [Vogesella sp. GCM10023246]|uniref:Phospholipase A1 n=1 Tax=Vogesella oryzagri TaxID=3160864 RepID=A0ABV1M704_9NEIS
MSLRLLCLLLVPLLAHATAPPTDCVALTAAAARLACYDAWAAANLPQATVAAAVATPADARAAPAASAPVSLAPAASAQDAALATATPALPELAPPPAAPLVTSAISSPLARQWDLDGDSKIGTFVLRAHQPTYILPLWYQFSPNARPGSPTQEPVALFGQKLSNVEVKYQISFKSKLWQNVLGTPADLWFGYTQQSHWQMYNKRQSSPFRDTDYEPELMLTTPLPQHWRWGDWRLRMAGVGLLHQSNGQTDPLSRSWNRVYAMLGAEYGNLSLLGRWWYRLPEAENQDDNPDMNRFMGYGDVQAIYHLGEHTIGGKLRYNALRGKGALQLDWTFPVAGRLRGYVQGFSGYGENLLDYNHHSRGVGVGLMLTDWLAN